MADLPFQTQDVSVKDNLTGKFGFVNDSNEQLVHDQDALTTLEEIRDGTIVISGSVTTSWEYYSSNDQAYVVTYAAQITGGATEQDFVLIRNPVASGVHCRLKGFTFSITTNTTGSFRVYRQASITTSGTTLNIGNFRTKTATGVVGAYSIPTVSARNNLFWQFDLNAGGVGIVQVDAGLSLILLEGDDLLFTLEQGSNNNKFSINITWAEEDIT